MEAPQKIKKELSDGPAIPLQGIYLNKPKTLIQKDTCTPMFTAALFTVVKLWKQHKCPPNRQVDNKVLVYIYIGILFGHKKRVNFTICNSMNKPQGYYAK